MSEHRFDIKQAAKLDSEGRLKDLRPYELLRDVAGVSGGTVGVDFGSGTGTLAIPMAQLAGKEGKVYAVDNSAIMHGHLRARNPPANLIFVEGDVSDTGLDSSIADICLLAFILHEVKQPELLIAEASRLLKPGGKLVVVEWRPELDSPGPPRHVRIARERLEQLFRQAGFSLARFSEWSITHYVAVGTK